MAVFPAQMVVFSILNGLSGPARPHGLSAAVVGWVGQPRFCHMATKCYMICFPFVSILDPRERLMRRCLFILGATTRSILLRYLTRFLPHL